MESGMTKTADWKGAIGFQLGNKLYVNMTGNVNDPVYLEGKVGKSARLLFSILCITCIINHDVLVF
jgi:hypothetical protein